MSSAVPTTAATATHPPTDLKPSHVGKYLRKNSSGEVITSDRELLGWAFAAGLQQKDGNQFLLRVTSDPLYTAGAGFQPGVEATAYMKGVAEEVAKCIIKARAYGEATAGLDFSWNVGVMHTVVGGAVVKTTGTDTNM